MKKQISFTLLPILLSVGGCATEFKPSTTEDSASIVFEITKDTTQVWISTFKNKRCESKQKIAYLSFKAPLLNPEVKPVHEVFVEPNKEFIASLQYYDPGYMIQYSCQIGISLTPSPRDKYKVIYSESATGCTALVAKWDEKTQKFEPAKNAIDRQVRCDATF